MSFAARRRAVLAVALAAVVGAGVATIATVSPFPARAAGGLALTAPVEDAGGPPRLSWRPYLPRSTLTPPCGGACRLVRRRTPADQRPPRSPPVTNATSRSVPPVPAVAALPGRLPVTTRRYAQKFKRSNAH